ncbi:hypothetical protein EVAR_97092_1 [Eumeta japonica]|uniref:Uncharacterized protein n=1 Tax=Eumeta variegata TaxID=151549 RepID=A0A4C1X8L0_EUMVA|nr:hypothetical protein EVAR_97092_1 [Eumeta japonica]
MNEHGDLPKVDSHRRPWNLWTPGVRPQGGIISLRSSSYTGQSHRTWSLVSSVHPQLHFFLSLSSYDQSSFEKLRIQTLRNPGQLWSRHSEGIKFPSIGYTASVLLPGRLQWSYRKNFALAGRRRPLAAHRGRAEVATRSGCRALPADDVTRVQGPPRGRYVRANAAP